MKLSLASAGATGAAGGAAGWLVTSDGLSTFGVGLVTAISCLFGMLSSASRVQETRASGTFRPLVWNAGAVWVAAFAIALTTRANFASAALIGLGVGLAGTKVLEVVEAGVVALTRRTVGERPVTMDQLVEMLGDTRQAAQKAISERVRDEKKIVERIDENTQRMDASDARSTVQDGRMDGMEEDRDEAHRETSKRIKRVEDRGRNSEGEE